MMLRMTLLLPLLSAACTFEPGGYFATLKPRLHARYANPAARDAGDGWQRLSNDYQVKVTRAELGLGPITLLAAPASGGEGAATFDPAHPPAGYSLCHNGHCHSSDGRLVPYAEIEAELAGGGRGAGLAPVLQMTADGPLDLLAPSERPLGCAPGCHLPRTRVVRLRASLARLGLEGLLRDSRNPARLAGEIALRWQWTPSAAVGATTGTALPALEAPLDLPVDREHAPDVDLNLQVELTGALFDGLDFAAALPTGGPLDLAAPANAAAQERLLANLREGELLSATVSR